MATTKHQKFQSIKGIPSQFIEMKETQFGCIFYAFCLKKNEKNNEKRQVFDSDARNLWENIVSRKLNHQLLWDLILYSREIKVNQFDEKITNILTVHGCGWLNHGFICAPPLQLQFRCVKVMDSTCNQLFYDKDYFFTFNQHGWILKTHSCKKCGILMGIYRVLLN